MKGVGTSLRGYTTIRKDCFRNRWGRFQRMGSPFLPHLGQALAGSLAQGRLDRENAEGRLEGQSVK